MVSGISGISVFQTVLANQAFRGANKNYSEKIDNNENINKFDEKNKLIEGTSFTGSSIYNTEYSEEVEKIKKFASVNGNELSNQDINYALRYGRSILVDKRA